MRWEWPVPGILFDPVAGSQHFHCDTLQDGAFGQPLQNMLTPFNPPGDNRLTKLGKVKGLHLAADSAILISSGVRS